MNKVKTIKTNIGMSHSLIAQAANMSKHGMKIEFVALEAGKGKTYMMRKLTGKQ